MTSTAGGIWRRIAGAWQREGGFTLYVATAAALPAAPADDGVLAYVADVDTVYRSRAGAWAPLTTAAAAPTLPAPVRTSTGLAGGDVVGAAVQATLTVGPYPNPALATVVFLSYGAPISGASVCQFNIIVNSTTGTIEQEDFPATSANNRSVSVQQLAVLAANTSHTIQGQSNRASGTGAFRYSGATDQRFNRLEVGLTF